MQEQLDPKPEEFYSEHKASILARDAAIEYAADTQHRLDSDPTAMDSFEIRADLQKLHDTNAQHAINRVDANLWRSQQHYRQNEGAYQEQATNDSREQGVNIHLDSETK